MTSITQIVNDANAKLFAARNKASDALESAINSLWELHTLTSNVDDALTRAIKSAFEERKSSGGKRLISGAVQEFIRKNDDDYIPCEKIAALYDGLNLACDAWERAWNVSIKEFESVVTLKILCQYHYEKHQIRLQNNEPIYDDDDY